jgi:hypothetical protein
MLPDIHNQHLTRSQSEQGALALKVLVFSALTTIRTLHIHDKYVFRHAPAGILPLILAHPYSLGSLATFLLGHNPELGAEKVIEEGGLPSRLRTEDGYEMVVEPGGNNLLEAEIRG